MSDQPRLLGGRYEVGALIGRGGMAEVHIGTDTRLGRQVAIKMLRSDLARDASFLTRFRREAQSSAGLNHASIVAVYDSGEDHGVDAHGQPFDVPFIVMEYVPGKTLREVLTQRGKLAPTEAARITEGILDALAYSHRMGIVHRDIKPANVMIGSDNSVKVMDFGIARAIADTNATMTQTQAVIGTAQYLSPEQAQGQQVDARSDLYSTGCLLFELLTGRPPFLGDSPVAIAYQHVGQAPPLPSTFEPEVPSAMDAVVLHALGKDREARYQSAAEFRNDLQAVRLGRPVSDAARGTAGAAAAGAATERIDALGVEPTEVYAATPVTRPGGGAAGAGSGAAGGAGAAAATGGLHRDTASMAPVRRDEDRRSRAGTWVVGTILGLLALALLGWGLNTYLDNQASEANLVAVPGVEGQPRATAQLKITQAGLVPEVSSEKSADVEADHVIRQSPEAAVRVSKGSRVKIVISSGKEAVPVPDLKGKTVDEARALLTERELTLGAAEEVNDTKIAKGKITESAPAAGDEVAPGTSVKVKVSSGKVTVPDLVGKTQNEAFTLLTEAGLAPKSTYEQTAEVTEGQVLAQDKKAGEVIDAGTSVTITVAQARPPTPTPPPAPTPSTPSPSVSPSSSPSTGPTP
jgi:beta-lactam-binding protein with PASTA domain/predicted Ser/Thr protein kinase